MLTSLAFAKLAPHSAAVMGVSWLVWLLAATLGLAQQMEPMNMCTQQTTAPACVLTFTPWMAPQVAPTSTYYETIVTDHLYVSTAFIVFEFDTDLTDH